ncbi:MAG: hypothetical protein ACLQDM_09320 [Bradyrhizobium sp.]
MTSADGTTGEYARRGIVPEQTKRLCEASLIIDFANAHLPSLERDDFSLNRHLALSFCLSMISAQTLRVCREGKPVPTFPDHAPGGRWLVGNLRASDAGRSAQPFN